MIRSILHVTIATLSLAGVATARQPNIVFILCDDLGATDVGCYGNDFVETPNIDRLAKQGTRFKQAYAAAPVCSPTRAALMTGEYPGRTGIVDFLDHDSPRFLDPAKHTTLNRVLSNAGYRSGLVGKWHLDTKFDDSKGGPKQHGWDEILSSETKYIADGDYFAPYEMMSTLNAGAAPGEYLTDRQTTEAIRFLERTRGANKPAFLYLSFYSVHTALDAPKPLVEKYKAKFRAKYPNPPAGQGLPRFDAPKNAGHLGKPDNPYLAAMTESIDANVGRLMKSLDDLGIGDDTLVIFTSDNGGDGRVTLNAPLRGAKSLLYEGGIRVAQIARWPNVVPAGRTSDVPTISLDYFPTFVELAGATAPPGQPQDGTSLVALLKGTGKPDRDTLCWHYPADTAPWPERAADAIREGDWKLIVWKQGERVELFDLATDPNETTNLVDSQTDRVRSLRAKLDAWIAETK